MAEYIYHNPVGGTFKPENSNMKEARARTNRLIDKLMKKGQLDLLKEEIQKTFDIRTLVSLKDEEFEEVLKQVHHFCYLNVVHSENSV